MSAGSERTPTPLKRALKIRVRAHEVPHLDHRLAHVREHFAAEIGGACGNVLRHTAGTNVLVVHAQAGDALDDSQEILPPRNPSVIMVVAPSSLRAEPKAMRWEAMRESSIMSTRICCARRGIWSSNAEHRCPCSSRPPGRAGRVVHTEVTKVTPWGQVRYSMFFSIPVCGNPVAPRISRTEFAVELEEAQ